MGTDLIHTRLFPMSKLPQPDSRVHILRLQSLTCAALMEVMWCGASQARTTTECDYLMGEGPEGLGALRHLTLYQSLDAAHSRGVFVLHMPVEQRWAFLFLTAHCSDVIQPLRGQHNFAYSSLLK